MAGLGKVNLSNVHSDGDQEDNEQGGLKLPDGLNKAPPPPSGVGIPDIPPDHRTSVAGPTSGLQAVYETV